MMIFLNSLDPCDELSDSSTKCSRKFNDKLIREVQRDVMWWCRLCLRWKILYIVAGINYTLRNVSESREESEYKTNLGLFIGLHPPLAYIFIILKKNIHGTVKYSYDSDVFLELLTFGSEIMAWHSMLLVTNKTRLDA